MKGHPSYEAWMRELAKQEGKGLVTISVDDGKVRSTFQSVVDDKTLRYVRRAMRHASTLAEGQKV